MDFVFTWIVAVAMKELCAKLVQTVSEAPNALSLGETGKCGVKAPIVPKMGT